MRVRLSPRALADLRAIRSHLEKSSPQGSDNVRSAIDVAISLLGDFPGLGRERSELGVRALGVARYPFTIYYRVERDGVWIVHIRDDRRKPLERSEL